MSMIRPNQPIRELIFIHLGWATHVSIVAHRHRSDGHGHTYSHGHKSISW